MRVGSYKEWEESVPEEIRADSLWKAIVYRRALFLGDLAWHDISKLNQNRNMWELCNQLYRAYRAVGSISANVAEGYSRGSRKDRARFYEYALGS